MKFAKELDQSAVPEWRVKYLDYRSGKKLIKSITRALNRVNQTPNSISRASIQATPRWTANFGLSPNQRNRPPVNVFGNGHGDTEPLSPRLQSSTTKSSHNTTTPSEDTLHSLPQAIPGASSHSREQQQQPEHRDFGSFVPTPPSVGSPQGSQALGGGSIRRHPTFELPEPALADDEIDNDPLEIRVPRPTKNTLGKGILKRTSQKNPDPTPNPEVLMAPPPQPNPQRTLSSVVIPASTRAQNVYTTAYTPTTARNHPLRRFFSSTSIGSPNRPPPAAAENLYVAQERERLLYKFMDDELAKVESFYVQKEDQAGKRLDLLRAQLHEMRNRRLEEMAELKRRRDTIIDATNTSSDDAVASPNSAPTTVSHNSNSFKKWNPSFITMVPQFPIMKPGPNSRALVNMPNTPHLAGMAHDALRDYVRKPMDHEVPYRTAKRKLKLALQEFYRGLELLKAYALLNRTAFRKLNKKYDKAVHARPPLRYVNEKVNKAWFVQSDVLEGHITAIEDLYARYFEKGNHKVAVGKLRSLGKKQGDHSGSAFWNGLLIGLALVFAVEGLVFGSELLYDSDPVVRAHTSYLLQIYAGFFLMLLLFTLFCIDCWVWNQNKVNYQFIFELDPRNQLDWRQLAEFPSVMGLLLGFFMWLNFTRYGNPDMYLYYPLILIGAAAGIIFMPLPIWRPTARKWFVYSHWRLLSAGIYPVEFRDFFLGDIYCSLTYATSNIALFFCLYNTQWSNPSACNSSHSRIMGFLAALPPIWRFLQCIRRFYDTRNWFPHLVNCGKYTMSIMAAVSLSLYRISPTNHMFALFVTFATINGFYTAIWDLFMDFSVLQPGARKYLLRNLLALKKKWIYYSIMTVDPLLRFSWIFYAIFRHNAQHSAIVSFAVSLSEVLRRGLWTLLRVENEHCSNVSQYKASRDIPLPYHIELRSEDEIAASPLVGAAVDHESPRLSPLPVLIPSNVSPGISSGATSSGVSPHPAAKPSPAIIGTPGGANAAASASALASTDPEASGVRKRRSTVGMSISKILAEAHRQDFEKKRKPEGEVEEEEHRGTDEYDDEEDDDDDDLDRSDTGSDDGDNRQQHMSAVSQLTTTGGKGKDTRGL